MRVRGIALVAAVAFATTMVITLKGFSAAPEKVTIDAVKKVKPAVVLNHGKHAKDIAKGNCAECHHKWDKASGKEPRKCTTCHKAKKEGNTPAAKTIFHKKCKDCHKKNKAKGAPTSCKGCHKK